MTRPLLPIVSHCILVIRVEQRITTRCKGVIACSFFLSIVYNAKSLESIVLSGQSLIARANKLADRGGKQLCSPRAAKNDCGIFKYSGGVTSRKQRRRCGGVTPPPVRHSKYGSMSSRQVKDAPPPGVLTAGHGPRSFNQALSSACILLRLTCPLNGEITFTGLVINKADPPPPGVDVVFNHVVSRSIV
ncbi:hypothetical protein J6590_034037 [Homalodisca vitripennis]|nr:hypothetical protein J6590_034037 [Homalodisca vitripennis]